MVTSWVTRKKKKGRYIYVLRTKTVGPDGTEKITERSLGRNAKRAREVEQEIQRAEKASFWGVGAMVTKKTKGLAKEISTLFAGRSDVHMKSVQQTFERFIKSVSPPEYLADVTPAHVDQFKLALMSRVSPVTVNKHLRNLRAVFGRAVKRGYLARNPVSMVDFMSLQEPAPKDLSFAEFGKFFNACEAPVDRVFFRVLAVTGLRVGELAVRQWEDLTLESHRLLITGTKTGRARITFLGEHSLELLMEYRRTLGNPINGPMFPPVIKHPSCRWSRRCGLICARAGLDHYTPKDIRSSYLPRGQELGRRFDVGDKGLGHKPKGIGARHYNPIDVELLRDYNEALDEALEDACQSEEIQLRDPYVTPPSKSSQTGRPARKSKRPASA